MPKFRYVMNGQWWKGNTHIHSTASDGGKTFEQLANLYASAGYHFLFRTDHWVLSDVAADPRSYPLLWLDGVELDGVDVTGAAYHVVALGSFREIQRSMGLQQAMESARAQGGILVLAHPQWMANTLEDALRWPFDGVEVYNHVCHWLNGKGDGSAYWNAMLAQRPNCLAFSSDDAHLKPDEPTFNGAWIEVNAEECTPAALLGAIRAGNFYASRGPRFESIQWDGEQVMVQCSPIRFARLVGPAWNGQRINSPEDGSLTGFTFTVPQSWRYVYLEIEDWQGRTAWSNPLFEAE